MGPAFPPLFLASSLTSTDPYLALAYDEALLAWMDQHVPDYGVFRVWEAASPFVVMGYGKHVSADVNQQACERDGVPILRRCSGGGTVLQTLGCLSYSLVLPVTWHAALATIQSTTSWVMAMQAACVQSFLHGQRFQNLPTVCVQGTSDLTIDALKISGNAQRRGRCSVLFHGTILCDVEISQISRYLRVPDYQPEYRQNRGHEAFLRSLGIAPAALSAYMCDWWGAVNDLDIVLDMTALVEKYRRPEWVFQR